MEVGRYVGKVVRINLKDGFFYIGTVETADEDSISLIDINGKWVTVEINNIALIREVDR